MNKTRILVVDDHEVVRQGVARILDGEDGLEICGEVGTGEEAVREAKRLNPDIIIMDVRLPGIDGLEATRRILRAQPGISVLVFTVNESKQMALEATKAGAKAYLTKTEGGLRLVDMLKSLVDRRGSPGSGPPKGSGGLPFYLGFGRLGFMLT